MKKTLLYVAATTLALAVSVSAACANPTKEAGSFPRVVSFGESPPGIRHQRILRHTLKLDIPQQSKAVSQLIINAPSNIIVRKDIDITDGSAKQFNANVSINGSKVILDFSEPVVPGTILTIDMNNVKKTKQTTGDKLYRISARLVGIDAELPIGVARLRVY